MSIDGKHFRIFLISGWGDWRQRVDLTQQDKDGVKAYLETGDPEKLPFIYQRLREKVRTNHATLRFANKVTPINREKR